MAPGIVCSRVLGRTERGLRMALGGALILALTMADLPTMDYSFMYIGPFLFFVLGTLAPPCLSSGVIVLFAGLFCILIACGLTTALVSCLLVSTGGQALCVFVYGLSVVWGSFLLTGKTKEMTLIGSYILLYAVPLAAVVASAYAIGGISIVVTPERYAALQEFIKNSSIEEISERASHFFITSQEKVNSIIAAITNPLIIKSVLQFLSETLSIRLPEPPGSDPKTIVLFFLELLKQIPPGRRLAFDIKLSRDSGLDLSQDWMYDVPLFVDGISGERLVVGARPGTWFIRAIWLASGPIGILRNLIIFAFLGFAVYLLVLLVPPIRRQRDIAVREMAAACGALRKCLQNSRRISNYQPAGVELKTADKENGACDIAHERIPDSEAIAGTASSPPDDTLDKIVLSLIDIEKAVLLSGMEPYLLYPGPGVFSMKELEAVRKKLIECCVQTQHMTQLFEDENFVGLGELTASLSPSQTALLAKSVEMYELCEKLLLTFPSVFSPSSSRKQADELRDRILALEGEMRPLAQESFSPVEAGAEEAFVDQETDVTVVSGSRTGDDERIAEETGKDKSLKRIVDILPRGFATTVRVHAEFSAPVLLGRCVSALSKAQEVNTFRGLLMNIAFPLVPLVVHLSRLVVVPLKSLAFWRLAWRGPSAWWRNRELWYALKLSIPLICIFACGIYLPDFRSYSWGVDVTDRPIFLDLSEQGVATRMVPWFILGYLTVLQTTYNGTVHRALARTVGILLGSFSGWVALKLCGSNVAGLVAFCSATVFLDIFIFADPVHPLDGFDRKWGYSGMVFTFTQSLIVTLSTEELGGLTGGRDYLVTTRIVSNMMGILLALLISHLPPLASATSSACGEYSIIVHRCATGVSELIHSFLCICGQEEDQHFATAPVDSNAGLSTSLVERECAKVSELYKLLDLECKELLGSASRFSKEGRYVPLLKPWKTSPSLQRVHVGMKSIVIESQEAAQLVQDVFDDYRQAKPSSTSSPERFPGEQELAAMPITDPLPGGRRGLSKRMSMPLMQFGNCEAIQSLFGTSKGSDLRESLRNLADSLRALAAAAGVELCASLPAFGDKLMCFKGGYAYQGDGSGGFQQAYESCRSAMDEKANMVTLALAECLRDHSAAHREARAVRTASAFVVMRLLYHLQTIKLGLDEVHAALIEGSKEVFSICNQLDLRHLGRRK